MYCSFVTLLLCYLFLLNEILEMEMEMEVEMEMEMEVERSRWFRLAVMP